MHKEDDSRKWEALLMISEEVHSAENIEDFTATVHETLEDLIQARNFFIALYDHYGKKYFFPYFKDEYDSIETVAVEAGYDESLETTLYDLSGTLTDHVRRTGLPMRFPNEEMTARYERGEIELFGSQSTSWLGVPLKHSGRTIGVMVVQTYGEVNTYSASDEELMLFVSDHLARAIETVRAEEKLRRQHALLLKQSQAITDSIAYASRLQEAVLPSPAYIKPILPEHFAIHRPKDIVSGDFYWVREIEGCRVVVVADCTGHGVPGALMSMLGITMLNEQFRTFGIQEPDVILGHLRARIKEILAPKGSGMDQKDGMDLAMVIIDPEKLEMKFAGANRPLYLFRPLAEGEDPKAPVKDLGGFDLSCELMSPQAEGDGESDEDRSYKLVTLRGDKQPVGAHWEETPFTRQELQLQQGDTLYLFSDGYVDQYGGKDRKKLKPRNFRNLLLSVQDLPMKDQARALEHAFRKWKGKHEQIDDVCLFGLRITSF